MVVDDHQLDILDFEIGFAGSYHDLFRYAEQ